MNEITVKLSPEQFATLQKLLEPYVLLSASLNAQYRAQQNILPKKLDPANNKEDLDEVLEKRR